MQTIVKSNSNPSEDIFKKVAEKRKELHSIARRVKVTSNLGSTIIESDEWIGVDSENVKHRLCSLNEYASGVTCCNVRFEPGGFTKPHKHDREETIFCADGYYYDPISKLVLRPGDVQVIPPGQLHAGKSTKGCLLFITWRPAFDIADGDTA